MSSSHRWKYLSVVLRWSLTAKAQEDMVQQELDKRAAQGWELFEAFATPSGGVQLIFRRSG